MAETRFDAFLSCSFDDGDKEVVDFFKGLIESFDIQPKVYNYQEIGGVADKVKEHINSSDCLIALATRRNKIEGTDAWSLPDWIQQEVAFANAYAKPIAVFIEGGVQVAGLIEREERREHFQRDDLIGNIHKLTRFLFNLRKHLESAETEAQPTKVMTRHYVRVNAQMKSAEELVQTCEILMEPLMEGMEAVPHTLELSDTSPGLSIRPKEFKFFPMEHPDHVKMDYSVRQETEAKFFFLVTFDPPLRLGEQVKYAYKEVLPNSKPYTTEELHKRMKEGTYPHAEAVVDGYAWSITSPTYELTCHFEFPENYEIGRCYPDVRLGRAGLKAEEELGRIQDGGLFRCEKIIDKWQFDLRVPKPLMDHTYYVFFEPPSEKTLVEA